MQLQAKRRLTAAQEPTEIAKFLPDRLVMLDCEMTGLDPKKDDVIQLAAIKLELKGFQYVPVGDPLNLYIHTYAQPTSAFALKYMKEVYEKARASEIDYAAARKVLELWMGPWLGKVSPAGDCVPTDILFLYMKDIIGLSHFDGDTPVDGTFHYEFFDMNAPKMVARERMGYKFDKDLPRQEGDHDALVDCINQTTELNGILKVLMGGTP